MQPGDNRLQDYYDAVIVGGGHNGLVTAVMPARAGLKTLVVEARPAVGGVASTEEFHPGYQVDVALHEAGMFRPQLVRELFLRMHNLEWLPVQPTLFNPLPNGDFLLLNDDLEQSREQLARHSAHDAAHFPDYIETMERFASILESALSPVPPDPHQLAVSDLWSWLGTGKALATISGPERYGLLRLLPMSLVEWMDEWFEHPAIRAALTAPGLTAIKQGPYSGGTAFALLYHYLGQRSILPAMAQARGGIGALSRALASAVEAAGAVIETDTAVARILVSYDQVKGVLLSDGRELSTSTVISSLDPRSTFTELVDPYELDPSFVRSVDNVRFGGTTAKVNLALDGLPTFTAAPHRQALGGRTQIAPSLEYLERAYDDAKYGRLPAEPFLDIRIPTIHDPGLAPAGGHVMSILVQWVPYDLAESDWESERERLGSQVVNTLAHYAPDLPQRILHQQVLTPPDLEREFGIAEGHLYHGQMMLDQLFIMRPVAGWARYRTPVQGLYLCGSGCHPGGGVTGMPGSLAAKAVIADWQA